MLRNVAQSLMPGSPLFIVGNMLDDSRLSPPVLVGQNLVFINIYDDGLIYTEAEYRALLVDAGFVDITVQQAGMPGGQALIWRKSDNALNRKIFETLSERSGRYRRNFVIAADASGDGAFSIRFADLSYRAYQPGGSLNSRPTPWQDA